MYLKRRAPSLPLVALMETFSNSAPTPPMYIAKSSIRFFISTSTTVSSRFKPMILTPSFKSPRSVSVWTPEGKKILKIKTTLKLFFAATTKYIKKLTLSSGKHFAMASWREDANTVVKDVSNAGRSFIFSRNEDNSTKSPKGQTRQLREEGPCWRCFSANRIVSNAERWIKR